MSLRKDFIDSLLDGASRLHRAAATETAHQVRDLIDQGADPNLRNWRGETPLHRAAIRNPDLDVHRALIDAGTDVNARDDTGATALHRAAGQPSPDRADLLIEAGADVNARDKGGSTPLHEAAGKGLDAGAKTLLKHGADPHLPDNTGRTPLHLAYAAERQDMVNRLLEAGANLEARDQEGRVPIQHLPTDDDRGRGEHEQEARANDSNEIRDMDNLPHRLRTGPEEYERIQNALNPADSEGRTPLHRAADNGSVLGVRKLLQAGADPSTADREGRTPIDVATARDSTPTVNVLRAASTQQQEPAHKEPRGGRRPGKTAEEYTQDFAAKLTQQIEEGTAPWQKSWKRGENWIPENFSTEKQYQGGNTLELMVQRTANSYNDHRWGTYRQIAAAGGHVRKGEQGTRILAYKPPGRRDTQETTTPGEGAEEKRGERDVEKTRRGTWKHYTVFNVEQAEGLKLPERKGVAIPQWEAQQNVEKVIRASGVTIREVNGDRAYYNMARDHIVLPERTQFKSAEAYYQTALHEVGHSTGHKSRMNRESLQQGTTDGFGSQAYAREELRAEISAMMSSERLGVAYEPQHGAAYVASWVKALKDDPQEIYKAAAEAGRISDYVCAAPERARAAAIEKAKDTPLATGKTKEERSIDAPTAAREPQPATPVAVKAPEIELSR